MPDKELGKGIEPEGMPQLYGLDPANLNEDLLRGVFHIYDRVTGGHAMYVGSDYVPLDQVREHINHPNLGGFEWRAGSRFSAQSKIWARLNWPAEGGKPLLTFDFDPNIWPRAFEKETDQISLDFQQAINTFLIEKGVGVPFTKRTYA